MITITKLQVNTVNNNLVISATDDNTDYYKFTKAYIDSTKTFNCKNEESVYADKIDIDANDNTPLSDYKIPFSDIITSETPENDILFVWLEAMEGYERHEMYRVADDSHGISYGHYVSFGDGSYYRVTSSVMACTESDYLIAKQYGEENGCAVKRSNYYYVNTPDSSWEYFVSVINGGATSSHEITKEEFDEATSYNVKAFGVTLSVKNFYDLLLNHINIEASDSCNCNVDCSDVNFMLAWQGFNLSKSLQDYNQMIKYWKILHSTGDNTSSSGCGCNK